MSGLTSTRSYAAEAPTRLLLKRVLHYRATSSSDEPAVFDKADVSADGIKRAGLLQHGSPEWWDATGDRVMVTRANLRGCSLRSAVLTALSCEQVDLTGADLVSACLKGVHLDSGTFDDALLEDADLSSARLRFASLRNAVLESATLRGADLRGASLVGAQMPGADFRDSDLEEADLRNVKAAGVDFRGARLVLTDLRGADLRGADLRDTILRRVRLSGADLRGALLHNVDLTSCTIDGAWLADAELDRTKLRQEQVGGEVGEEIGGRFDLARRAYLNLEQNFMDIGEPDAASWAYARRRCAQKRQAYTDMIAALHARAYRRAAARLGQYATDSLVEAVCGYGENVVRVLITLVVVFAGFMLYYAAAGAVVRHVGDDATGTVTRAPLDLLLFTSTAMLAPGSHPEGLDPAGAPVLVVSLLQSFISIFLIGLLGFVAGNRIRR